MNKFTQILSQTGDALLLRRAKGIADTTEMRATALVNAKKEELLNLQQQKEKLLDLGINDTTSLSPADKNYNATDFVQSLFDLSLDIRLAEEELTVAEELYHELFSNIETVVD